MINVVIVNRSTVVTDAAAISVVAALQTQLNRDFLPFWGAEIGDTVSPLGYVGRDAASPAIPPGSPARIIALLDHTDEQGDLGYHEDIGGIPDAKVFCADDAADGVEWSVTLSHELLEMLADPDCTKTATDAAGRIIGYEVCDPVESDEDGYLIGSVRVSNFALPAWFSPAGTVPTVFCGHDPGPFGLNQGGYMSILVSGNWTEQYGDRGGIHETRHERAMRRGTSRLIKRRDRLARATISPPDPRDEAMARRMREHDIDAAAPEARAKLYTYDTAPAADKAEYLRRARHFRELVEMATPAPPGLLAPPVFGVLGGARQESDGA